MLILVWYYRLDLHLASKTNKINSASFWHMINWSSCVSTKMISAHSSRICTSIKSEVSGGLPAGAMSMCPILTLVVDRTWDHELLVLILRLVIFLFVGSVAFVETKSIEATNKRRKINLFRSNYLFTGLLVLVIIMGFPYRSTLNSTVLHSSAIAFTTGEGSNTTITPICLRTLIALPVLRPNWLPITLPFVVSDFL